MQSAPQVHRFARSSSDENTRLITDDIDPAAVTCARIKGPIKVYLYMVFWWFAPLMNVRWLGWLVRHFGFRKLRESTSSLSIR